MTEDIQVGDVVQLKSGGSRMVVGGVRDDGVINCEWHTDSGSPVYAAYDLAMLNVEARPLSFDEAKKQIEGTKAECLRYWEIQRGTRSVFEGGAHVERVLCDSINGRLEAGEISPQVARDLHEWLRKADSFTP